MIFFLEFSDGNKDVQKENTPPNQPVGPRPSVLSLWCWKVIYWIWRTKKYKQMDKCLSGKHTNKNLNEKWKKLRDALKHSLHFKFSYSYVQILITKIIPTRNFGFCWKIFSSLKRENQFLSIIIWNEKPEQCVAWEGGWWSIGEAGIRCHNIHLLRG